MKQLTPQHSQEWGTAKQQYMTHMHPPRQHSRPQSTAQHLHGSHTAPTFHCPGWVPGGEAP